MQPYVHILGRTEIDPTVARVILSIEHFGNVTRVWVENDEHEPYGYIIGDPGYPHWKAIICGNEACVVDGCIRKAYFEQLRQQTIEEVVERDAQADHAETLAENLALAEESEERRQEIERISLVLTTQNEQLNNDRLWMQMNLAELDDRNRELDACKQEIARLTEKVNRYRRLIQDTIAVLEASQEDDDIALAVGLKGMIGDDR